MITLLEGLVNQVGSIVLVAVLLSRFAFFRRLVTRDKIALRYLIILAIVFGMFGILKTYSGIPVKGALANARVVGVFVGGLIGGPVVGILAGIIAGVHRWAIDIGGFTAFACMVSLSQRVHLPDFSVNLSINLKRDGCLPCIPALLQKRCRWQSCLSL